MNNKSNRRASTGGILLTSIFIQALLVGGFWYFEPLRKSTMSADKQQIDEQLEEVKKRSEERSAREKREREQKKLRKEDAEKLKKEEEQKRKRKLIEKIEELHELEQELDKLKDDTLDELQERDVEDIAKELAADLERQANELTKRAEEADREFDDERSEETRKLAEEIREQAKEIRQDPQRSTEQLREQSREMERQASEMEREADDSGEQRSAERLQQAAERLSESARALANINGEQESQEELLQQAEQLAQDLVEQAGELQQDAQAADQQFGNEQSQTAESEAGEVVEQSQQIADNPLQSTDAIQESSQQIQQQAQQLREQGGSSEQQQSAQQLEQSAQQMQQTAQALERTQQDLGTQLPSNSDMQNMQVEDLHALAQDIEQSVSQHFADIRAAELAMNQNTGFQEARDKISDLGSAAADIPGDLSQQQVGNVGELNEYRDQLDQVVQSATAMRNNAQNMANQARGMAPQAGAQQQGQQNGAQTQAAMSALQQAANGRMGRSVDLSSVMRQQMGVSMGNGQAQVDETHAHKAHEVHTGLKAQGIRQLQLQQLNEGQIKAEALPGRMFTKDSKRTGWLYLDTWYVIGPWQAGFPGGKVDYSKIYPPEITIDLDATYKDGKPYRFGAKKGQHRELAWRFFQSSTLRTTPPDEQSDSVYYCYTEVFFEEDTDMLIAVGTDDAAKVWINDLVVWQDDGLSPWSLKEGFRKVFFKKGHNTVLMRLTNGPVVCQWSVLLCPYAE